jgi:Ca2+-binding EF-hand superfamily protein
MDTDGDGKVSCLEFVEFMLVAMDKCDKSDIDKLKLQFSRLDVDGTGVLEKEDLVIVAKRKLKNPKRKLKLAEYKQKLLRASLNQSS